VDNLTVKGAAFIQNGATSTMPLHIIGAYSSASFMLSDDGAGGSVTSVPPVSSGSAIAPPH
jgi:hypothetical protein